MILSKLCACLAQSFLLDMDERIIEVEIYIEPGDYRRILYWYHRTSLIINGILAGLFLLIGLLALVAIALSGKTAGAQNINVVFLFLPTLFIGLVFGLKLFNIWRQSKAVAEIAEPTRYLFDETGISSVATSSSSQIVWEKYVKVVETKSDFIFFPMKKRFFPFPKRFFNNPDDILALRDLISEKLGKAAKLLTN